MTRRGSGGSTLEDLRSFCERVDDRLGDGYRAGRTDADLVCEDGVGVSDRISRSVDDLTAPETRVEADLHVAVERDLSEVRYRTETAELTVPDPASLWPCTCLDAWTREGEDCPIHDRAGGAAVAAAFADGDLLTTYDGARFYWFHADSLFPITTDSVAMYENLRADGVTDGRASSLVEVGCGTGFAAVELATRGSGIDEVALCDCYATPLLVSGLNHRLNARSTDAERRLFLTDGFRRAGGPDLTTGPRFDVCVCNPPYLPEMDSWPDGASVPGFTGTELLQSVVARGGDVADAVYLHISELAAREAEAAATERGARLVPVGERRTVPFRVHSSLDVDAYVAFLEDRGLTARPGGRYPYSHEIATYRVEYAETGD